jgi:hypothetical protein
MKLHELSSWIGCTTADRSLIRRNFLLLAWRPHTLSSVALILQGIRERRERNKALVMLKQSPCVVPLTAPMSCLDFWKEIWVPPRKIYTSIQIPNFKPSDPAKTSITPMPSSYWSHVARLEFASKRNVIYLMPASNTVDSKAEGDWMIRSARPTPPCWDGMTFGLMGEIMLSPLRRISNSINFLCGRLKHYLDHISIFDWPSGIVTNTGLLQGFGDTSTTLLILILPAIFLAISVLARSLSLAARPTYSKLTTALSICIIL